MNTAEYAATLPLPIVASLAHATPQEYSLYAKFARPCHRIGGWETTSRGYTAMKEECAKRGLRSCSFPHFREVVRRFRKNDRRPNRCSPPYGFEAMSVSRGPTTNFLDLAAGWRWVGMSGQ
ncbi:MULTISPECIES: hypothetical protein [Rhizobium]|uniref:hypothetical protein n=1 Tax=Rhizobium TaxID=379 RepID=UPI001441902C|nr:MULTISPECIES: hypothetical protein [Rhizobium]MBN9983813.1 hypothetical protein [Rhizobium laguerreae]NKK36297.1 hypothetical protein [Rhizobium leguminosarum bv. viciae]NKL79104.1 hypothetical protein [Rhizobium leguminosarum bv. viciae]